MPCGKTAKDIRPNRICGVGLMNVVVGAVLLGKEAALVNKIACDINKFIAVFAAHFGKQFVKCIDILVVQLFVLAAFEHIHCTDNVNLRFGAFAANIRNDFGIVVRSALNTPNGNVVQSEQNEDLFAPIFLTASQM